MIEDIYLAPAYWLTFAFLFAGCAMVMKFHVLDFKFMFCVLPCQYIAHVSLAYGFSTYQLFCILFLVLLVVGYKLSDALPDVAIARTYDEPYIHLRLIQLCKISLCAYNGWRLYTFPIWSGSFDLAARLAQRQENRALFFLSLVMAPLFVACLYDWIQKRRVSKVDWLVITLFTLGSLSTGSKGTFLPLILGYAGVTSYLGRQIRIGLPLIVSGASVSAALLAALHFYFPKLALGGLVDLIVYRIVANTDNVEYMLVTHVEPSQYPYAGVVSFVPFLSKLIGVPIDYSYGVWLNGTRSGDWSGFGPNSGLLIEQYGNLGWAGLTVALALGLLVGWTEKRRNALRAMILSVCSILMVESSMFILNLSFILLLFALALCSFPLRIGHRARTAVVDSHADRTPLSSQ